MSLSCISWAQLTTMKTRLISKNLPDFFISTLTLHSPLYELILSMELVISTNKNP